MRALGLLQGSLSSSSSGGSSGSSNPVPLQPDMRSTVYRLALWGGGRAVYDTLLDLYKQVSHES